MFVSQSLHCSLVHVIVSSAGVVDPVEDCVPAHFVSHHSCEFRDLVCEVGLLEA